MDPKAFIKIRDIGTVTVELYPQNAPNSVASFIWCAEKGIYDNKPIKRIAPHYVIQPSYDDFGAEEAKFSIAGEFRVCDGKEHTAPTCGTLILSGDGQHFSSGSCFCFVLDCDEEHQSRLNDRFAVIGRVTEGWDIVEKVEFAETFRIDLGIPVEINEPVKPIIIESVTVEKYGAEFPAPEVLFAGSLYDDPEQNPAAKKE